MEIEIFERETINGYLILSTIIEGKHISHSYIFYTKEEAHELFVQKVKDVLNGKSNEYTEDIFANVFND